jgi:DNA-binding CsgD family transcriptional regulator
MLRISKQLLDVTDESDRPVPVTPLSEQERRVLSALSEGKSPAVVAADLRITSQTLRNHLYHINQKLGTHSRLQAVTHAIRRRLI